MIVTDEKYPGRCNKMIDRNVSATNHSHSLPILLLSYDKAAAWLEVDLAWILSVSLLVS